MAETITSAPIQKKITSTSVNFDILSEPQIASELLSKYNYTSEIIRSWASPTNMKITILPDTECTVIVNGYEQSAPDFYTTGGFSPIKTFKIKESGISALVSIQIR